MFLDLNHWNDRFTLTEKEMAVRGGAAGSCFQVYVSDDYWGLRVKPSGLNVSLYKETSSIGRGVASPIANRNPGEDHERTGLKFLRKEPAGAEFRCCS